MKPKSNFHGYTSIILFFFAIAIGIYAISHYSVHIAIINAVALLLMILSVSFYYCSKCLQRTKCNHWLFGKISVRLSKFKDEKYNAFDLIFGTIVPLLIVIALPQFWLIKAPLLLIAYWSLMVIAGLQVSLFVCKQCDNQKCSMCKNKIKTL